MAADVRLAITDRLLTLDVGFPVNWENEGFDPPAGGYLDVQLFRSATNRQYVQSAGTHVMLGFLQIAVMAPKDRAAVEADRIADAIVAHFPCDLRLGPVRITQTPHVAGGFPDGAWFRLPISIFFQATLA
jgi:hypothetical protein